MKRMKTYPVTLFTAVFMALCCMSLSSCGDEDNDEIIRDSPQENTKYEFYHILKNGCSTYYYDNKQQIRIKEAFGDSPFIPEPPMGSEVIRTIDPKTGKTIFQVSVSRWDKPSKIVFDSSVSNYESESLAFFFADMSTLETIEGLEYLNTSEVTDMFAMFYGCKSLTNIDISTFDTRNVKDMELMFMNCPLLTTIYVGDKWDTGNIQPNEAMFEGSDNLVGGMGTKKEKGKDGSTYAHIDGGSSNPGYLTYKK